MWQVYNVSQEVFLAQRVIIADGFLSRLVGLLNRKKLAPGEGLLIKPCQAIHTCFMRFAIDVVFLDRDGWVVGIVEEIKPFRFSSFFKEAVMALELPKATVKKTNTQIGDCLEIRGNGSSNLLFFN
ncbi:MAG: DUF192 domain-containing protein [Thermincolia bacterium]